MSTVQAYTKENAFKLVEYYKTKIIGFPITPILKSSKIYDVSTEPFGKNKFVVNASATYRGTEVKQTIQSVAKNLNLTLPEEVLKKAGSK